MARVNERKTAITAVIYGIIGVISTATGIALLMLGQEPIIGITLIIAGLSGFGMSCFARPWLFQKKNTPLKQ